MPCTQVNHKKTIKGRDEATQIYFTGQETLSITRDASECIQTCRKWSVLTVTQNCLLSRDITWQLVDTHQGRALSLQNLIKCKSHCIVFYGACWLSDEVHIVH